MLVADLDTALANRKEEVTATSVSDIEIADNAATITVAGSTYPIDEIAERALAKYFNIPYTYLKSCPQFFKGATLKFWRDEYSDYDVMVETIDDNIVGVHSPEVLSIPIRHIGRVITSVFDEEDTVKIYRPAEQLMFDVISKRHQVEVLNPGKIRFRPEVGDITHGGVRMLFHPHADKPPSVVPYLERLVCTNGMCADEKLGRVNIKGNTTSEILAEIEAAAERAMRGIDGALEKYQFTSEQAAPGSPLAFALQLGRELKLPVTVMEEVVVLINQLPEDASVYDVNQAFTSVANLDVPHSARIKLQTLGGSLAFEAERMIQRCNSCEKLLG